MGGIMMIKKQIILLLIFTFISTHICTLIATGGSVPASQKTITITSNNPYFLEKAEHLQQRSEVCQFAQQLGQDNPVAQWLWQEAGYSHAKISDIVQVIRDEKTYEEKVNTLSNIMQQRNADYIKSRNQNIIWFVGGTAAYLGITIIMMVALVAGCQIAYKEAFDAAIAAANDMANEVSDGKGG